MLAKLTSQSFVCAHIFAARPVSMCPAKLLLDASHLVFEQRKQRKLGLVVVRYLHGQWLLKPKAASASYQQLPR